MVRRGWPILLLFTIVVLGGAVGAFAQSVNEALTELEAASDELGAARSALAAQDVAAVQTAMAAAEQHSAAALASTTGPLWSVAQAVPVMGVNPQAVQALATSLNGAVTAIEPAVETLTEVRAAMIANRIGRIDTGAVENALPTLERAQQGVQSAFAILASSPTAGTGAMVVRAVEDARGQLGDELRVLGQTLDGALGAVTLLPALAGADQPKRYFLAILNPSEARGLGGNLWGWAIVGARQGRLTVEQVGSSSDLPPLNRPPGFLGEDFVKRYGEEALLVTGMNSSPNYPDAAQLWLRSWQKKTGERLDGALVADVVALGRLVSASGRHASLPDGRTMSGEDVTRFALTGEDAQFADAPKAAERKAFQEVVVRASLEAFTRGAASDGLVGALASSISEGRVLAWVRDDVLEERILTTSLGGALAVKGGPQVAALAINPSAWKLDAYLQRSVRYEVGSCVDARNRVRSRLEFSLTNAIPEGARLPEYLVPRARAGRSVTPHSTLAQIHLPNGAQILEVDLDGQPATYSPFMEQGRPSLFLGVRLPPGRLRTVTVLFREPRSGAVPVVRVQPLAQDQHTEIVTRPCDQLG